MNSMLLADFYKVHHHNMYTPGCQEIYSNWTPRKSRIPGIDHVVTFYIQVFLQKYLIDHFNQEFFSQDIDVLNKEYGEITGLTNFSHITALHQLGYLPLEVKSLEEGSLCPIGVPMLTIKNTRPDILTPGQFYWLTNYLETLMSCVLWQPQTSATIAYEYRRILAKYAMETTGSIEFVQWQGHDFSMRGMAGPEAAMASGMGHLLSFTGTDTLPAIWGMKMYYNPSGLVGASVPATEHSVMCLGTKDGEIETFKRLLDTYPTGILSVVSDTWDLWKVCTEYLPTLKEEILSRDGKLVIRPDSGDPVDIICGTNGTYEDLSRWYKYEDSPVNHPQFFWDSLQEEVKEDTPHGECGVEEHSNIYKINGKLYKATVDNIQWDRYDKQYYYIEMYTKPNIVVEELEETPVQKGVIELLWNVFGGTINEQGYKVLDPHIGAIYGDSITLERAKEICERLKAKGFASTNIVFGIGSYTYQYQTRDTFGFAMKATHGKVLVGQCKKDCEEAKLTGVDDICSDGCVGEYVENRPIFKDPITDDGTKKSLKGFLKVVLENGKLKVIDQVTEQEAEEGELKRVFLNGSITRYFTLEEIRERLSNQ